MISDAQMTCLDCAKVFKSGLSQKKATEILVGEEDDALFGDAMDGEATGEIEEIPDAEAEDMAPKRVSPDPGRPTQSEIDDHMIDHMPYRCWCEECVKGRGTGEQHREGTTGAIPIIGFDYLFIVDRGIMRRDELEEHEIKKAVMKILVVKDLKSKAIFAHVVPQKGVDADGYSVVRLMEDVRWLGYTKVILKADNERAIVKLLAESLRRIKTEAMDQVMREHPPSYDSRSNGSIENAVRQVQAHLRTMKFSLERRVSSQVPASHAIMSWLVEHVAWILTSRTRGEDGRTAYHRIRGRNFSRRLLEFGERCLYKLPGKGKRHEHDGKLAEGWRRGIFLGFGTQSNEYVLWDGGRIVKARCHQRLRSELRWLRGALESVTLDPHSTYAAMEAEEFTKLTDEAGDMPEAGPKRKPQTIQIKKRDWEKHNSTPGCAKCSHADEYGWGLCSGPHSPECVERFKRYYLETESGRTRVQRAEERQARERRGEQAPEPEAERSGEARAAPRAFVPPRSGAHGMLEKFLEGQDAQAVRDNDSPSYQATDPGDERMEPDAGDDVDAGAKVNDVPMEDETVDVLQPILEKCVDGERGDILQRDAEILSIIEQLGGCRKRYKRHQAKQMRALVSEVYSPPGVTACAKLLPSLKVIPGFALDLTTTDSKGVAWDFDKLERRQEARRLIEKEKPMLLVGSPMCTAFCSWQVLNEYKRDPEQIRREWTKAMIHLQFVCELYEMQVKSRRYFLHEHPVAASSWSEACVSKILNLERVQRVNGDQCQYGQRTQDGQPVKKPTGWMSNSEHILEAMGKRCSGRGGACSAVDGAHHAVCEGKVARNAAIYPFALCKAILRGFRKQLKADGIVEDGAVGMQVQESREHMKDVEIAIMEFEKDPVPALAAQGVKVYRDAITGQPLVPELVRLARQQEMDYFASKGVWRKRPRSEAFERTGKRPISVKWVDVNKGDDEHPMYRSRLVACEFRMPGDESIFAPTPPLEALRTVVSMAATNLKGQMQHVRDADSEMRTQVAVIDISRAYFNAKKDPNKDPTYVDLPSEDGDKSRGMCGLLQVHMYGTRAAAEGWHGEYSTFLTSIGFVKGDASACVFRHGKRHLVVSVHGDDFTIAGPKANIDWMKSEMEGKYELTETGRIGPAPRDGKELKVLNRLVRWCGDGLEYEADPRQAEKIIGDLDLEGAKTVGSPGVKITSDMSSKDEPLEEGKHTAFRSVAARGNYLAADRPDIQFGCKEICRWMAQPSQGGVRAVKRLGRYLEGHRRVVFRYPFQDAESVEVYSDTDWAGCVKTRKSTSGGCLLLGGHLIKSWSSTQGLVSLSSGEAEFYGVTKAAGIALGYKSLLRDLGVQAKLRVWTDSSATVGICSRQGLGKLRHIDTRSLWVQQKLREGALELRKVRGEVNPADLFTKHLSSEDRIRDLLKLFGCCFRGGRAAGAPQLRKAGEAGSILAVDMLYSVDGMRVEHEGYVYPGVDFEGEPVADGYLHDERMLPHQIPGDIAALFPRIVAAEAKEEESEEEDWLERLTAC